jgi:cytochrome c-type biogenesis protein CcmF
MAVAVAISATLGVDETTTMRPGDSTSIGGYTLTYDQLVTRALPDDARVSETRAELTVSGRQSGQLSTALRSYPSSTTAIATPAVWTTPGEDLYVTLLSYDAPSRTISLRVFINPLVVWIWVGGGIVAIGAVFAIWPDRRRVAVIEPAAEPARVPAEA